MSEAVQTKESGSDRSNISRRSSSNSMLTLSVTNLVNDENGSSSNSTILSKDFEPKPCQSCDDDFELDSSKQSMTTDDEDEDESFAEDIKGLQSALASLQAKLTNKDIEIAKLTRIRESVEAEVEDLTASLFEEAHKMVREANVKQASAEKALAEATMKIEGLETEVVALKTLVLTSTPSQPNRHLHPQLDPKANKEKSKSLGFRGKTKKESGSPEHTISPISSKCQSNPINGHHQNYCQNGTPASLKNAEHHDSVDGESTTTLSSVARNIDPLLRKDFLSWKKHPTLDRDHPFLARIYREDIDLCLAFPNEPLARNVRQAIMDNTLCLSPIKDFTSIPRDCALLLSPVLCRYSLRLNSESDDSEQTKLHYISQLARNRLAAVCDCINYFRYVHQGLVKASVNDVYWSIMKLRKHMVLARLGFPPDSA